MKKVVAILWVDSFFPGGPWVCPDELSQQGAPTILTVGTLLEETPEHYTIVQGYDPRHSEAPVLSPILIPLVSAIYIEEVQLSKCLKKKLD